MNKFSIGIVTFDKRFNLYYRPLLTQIKKHWPDVEIICPVNGVHNSVFPQGYRRDFLNFISDYDFVYPAFFPKFRSLASLWNHCLIASSNDSVLVLNDDVQFTDEFFDPFLQLDDPRTFTLNKSWSHFVANRREINEVGWFDERFLGVGNEDGDMNWRYNKFFDRAVTNHQVPGVLNFSSQTTGDLDNQRKTSKYSMFNHHFFREKYEINPSGFSDGWTWDGNKLIQKLDDVNAHPTESFFWDRSSEL